MRIRTCGKWSVFEWQGAFADHYRFHIVTAYDILRMKGVDVGKMDFLNGAGGITIEDVPQQ